VVGKKSANLSLKFGVLIIGEIEQQIFYAPATFLIGKKSSVKLTQGLNAHAFLLSINNCSN
jgi:hypothetical protein